MVYSQRQNGFTLIELLIASAVLAIISGAAFTGWYQVQQATQHASKQSDRIDQLERTWYWMNDDFGQLIDRPVNNQSGQRGAALSTGNLDYTLITLTRSGWGNPTPTIVPSRSNLQRVGYGLKDNKLYRYYNYHIDNYGIDTRRHRLLLTDVKSMNLKFLNRENQWLNNWPPLTADGTLSNELPRAIEVQLELDDLGAITRRFLTP